MTLSGMWLVLLFVGLQVLAGILFIAAIGSIIIMLFGKKEKGCTLCGSEEHTVVNCPWEEKNCAKR
jgi:hypothetical protein